MNDKEDKIVYSDWFSKFKYKANRRKIKFDLTKEDVIEMLKEQNFRCALTNDKIKVPLKRKAGSNASIDRIDSSLGYTRENCQITTKDANLAKQSLSTEEFLILCEKILRHFKRIT